MLFIDESKDTTVSVDPWSSVLEGRKTKMLGEAVLCLTNKSFTYEPCIQVKTGYIYKDVTTGKMFFYDGRSKCAGIGPEGHVHRGKIWFDSRDFTKQHAEQVLSDYFRKQAVKALKEAKKYELMAVSFGQGDYKLDVVGQ